MAKPRRGVKPAPKKKRRRVGTILFFVGLLAVLGGTFAAGALAGRLSLKPMAVVHAARSAERAPKVAPPQPQPPELTFYRELTAPLTVPPPLPKPGSRAGAKKEGATQDPPRKLESVAVTDGPKAEAPDTDAAKADTPKPETPSTTPPARGDAARYTVQVASYNVRAQAEALRARLATGGHDAYVAEGEAGGVTRYRVRIGSFATAEDARQAAVRLASQAQVATYVTTR